LYVYPNWFKGEIIEGPIVSRYWVTIKLRYNYKEMPDPKGAVVLSKVGVIVEFAKESEGIPVQIKSPDDYEPGTKKPKIEDCPIWIVTLQIPRRVIDEADLDDLELLSDEVDIDDIADASDEGLDDDI